MNERKNSKIDTDPIELIVEGLILYKAHRGLRT
jgi:hypothetical protein